MEWNITLAVSDLTGIWVNNRNKPEELIEGDVFTVRLKLIHNFGIRALELFPSAVINANPEKDFQIWRSRLERPDPAYYAVLMGRYAKRIVDCIEETPDLDNYHRYLIVKFGHYCRKPPQYAYPPKPFGVENDPYYPLTKEFLIGPAITASNYRDDPSQFYGTIYTSIKSPMKEEN